jgi:DNA-binding LacI/PurR family transcriptional regulator
MRILLALSAILPYYSLGLEISLRNKDGLKVSESSWRTIAEKIRRRIEDGELAAGARLPSEDALAVEWGVNRHTAHRALHELQRQGYLVRQRRWGTVVASRETRRHNRIAFVVAIGYGSFVGELMRAIERNLGEEVHLLVADTQDDPQREAWHLRRLRNEVDGILCFPTGDPESAPIFRELMDDGFPVVFVDRAPIGFEEHVVLSDNREATFRAVNALIARGHRRIAFFCGDNVRVQSVRERYEGYQAAMALEGLEDPEALVRRFPLALEHSPRRLVATVREIVAELRSMPSPPTAVFCVQDYLMVGAIEACASLGLGIPEEFEVAGFNDCPPMTLRLPWRLDRVVQDPAEIGRIAVDRLTSLIEGGDPEPGPVRVPAQFHSADAGSLGISLSSTSPVLRGLSTTVGDSIHEIRTSLHSN